MAAAINTKNIGLTASVSQDSKDRPQPLHISSRTGEENSFAIAT
jgi:hypothetical protein